jgi:hypothetical protein
MFLSSFSRTVQQRSTIERRPRVRADAIHKKHLTGLKRIENEASFSKRGEQRRQSSHQIGHSVLLAHNEPL